MRSANLAATARSIHTSGASAADVGKHLPPGRPLINGSWHPARTVSIRHAVEEEPGGFGGAVLDEGHVVAGLDAQHGEELHALSGEDALAADALQQLPWHRQPAVPVGLPPGVQVDLCGRGKRRHAAHKLLDDYCIACVLSPPSGKIWNDMLVEQVQKLQVRCLHLEESGGTTC